MHPLRDENVFFEPAYELHYYEALGHLARAKFNVESAATARAASLRSWNRFLQAGGDHSKWAERARYHIEELERALRKRKASSKAD